MTRPWSSRGRELALTVSAVLGVICIVWTVVVVVIGIRPLVFMSGSMAPSIETGALAFARPTAASDLRVGDVVSVTTSSGTRVTHRVAAVRHEGQRAVLTLKGDANSRPDAEPYVVTGADRVVADVPKAGYVVEAVSGPVGAAGAGMLMALVLLAAFAPRGGAAPRRRGGSHRRARLRPMMGAGTVVAAAALVGVLAGSATSTLAYFTDTGTANSGVLGSGTIPKPAAVDCVVNNPLLGTKSLTTSWAAASAPIGITYGAVVRETGTVLTVTGTGSTRSAKVTGGLLGSLLGTTFHIDVTATFAGTSWTAASTRTGTFILLGLGFTCGTWT